MRGKSKPHLDGWILKRNGRWKLKRLHKRPCKMSLHGRGCLEIKASPNPFFQTTTSEIGSRPTDDVQWRVNGKTPPFQHGKHVVDGNFAFLYTRESDRIGSKVPKPETKDIRVLTKTEFLKKKREESEASGEELAVDLPRNEKRSPVKRNADDILAVYKHETRYEDPRYTTSTNEYGKKPPSVATVVTERAARPQGFSKSFNGIKPMNTSLTTSITRSNVHKTLDPQFM